jgi:hypothetical protein
MWVFIIPLFFEILLERKLGGKKTDLRDAIAGLIVGGLCIGTLTVIFVPQRVLPEQGMRGISLLISPLVTGVAMKAWGFWRWKREMNYSYLATFWGGALFALFMAAARLLLVQ